MSISRRLQTTRWGFSRGSRLCCWPWAAAPRTLIARTASGAGRREERALTALAFWPACLRRPGIVSSPGAACRRSSNSSTVIVWVPDSFEPPSEEQREFLEDWLWNEPGRTLIYVGRDYDAAITYWRKVQPQAPPEQTMEVARRLATVQAEFDASRAILPEEKSFDWFTVRSEAARRPVPSVEGPWSQGIEGRRLELELGARFETPAEAAIQSWVDRRGDISSPEFTRLLTAQDATLVSRLTAPEWDQGQILVVTNGSFLLNLPAGESPAPGTGR